ARAAYQRPEVNLISDLSQSYAFQVRSIMTRGAASGLIGNYLIDRRTGRIWRGLERDHNEVDSFGIRDLREHILASTERGVFLDVTGGHLLTDIKKFANPPLYSLWEITLGSIFPNATSGSVGAITFEPLKLNKNSGQLLTGYRVDRHARGGNPLVEVYLG